MINFPYYNFVVGDFFLTKIKIIMGITDKKIGETFIEDLNGSFAEMNAEFDIRAIYVNQGEEKIVVEIGYTLAPDGSPIFLFDTEDDETEDDDSQFARAYRGEMS